jgi:CRISPR-associated protein Cas1
MIRSKIHNQRVLLRRNGDGVEDETLLRMKELGRDVAETADADALMGVEGAAAAFYFRSFARMLKSELRERFQFDTRNRRPPRDPVNALLSFGYACLVREVTNVLHGVGLDPYVGMLHRPRAGRPALALDLMEEFRPLIADSAVINAINNGVVGPEDFLVHPTGVALKDGARSRFIEVLERRLDELVTHPVFETRLSYRRVLEIQARLLGRVLTGELPAYPEFRTR